ncbi:hypothetical protein GCM10027053_16370 [Intrasporangium mesophilum]
MTRPVLASSCSRATTAAEARYRIDYALAPSRATRVIALDAPSEALVRQVAAMPWHHTRFYSLGDDDGAGELQTVDGERTPLAPELADVDSVIMVCASDRVEPASAAAASTIGAACTVRGIMTAALVVTETAGVGAVLAAIRPHARMLLCPATADDLPELLSAIRA